MATQSVYEGQSGAATRRLPISPTLKSALTNAATQAGVTVRVFSGGQAAKGEGGKRTGSTRHDHGNAADVYVYKDGRQLDFDDPADRPIIQQFIRASVAEGITGIGAAKDYMGTGIHLGYGRDGKPGETIETWGKGGKFANAPAWLRETVDGLSPGATAYAADGTKVLAKGSKGETVKNWQSFLKEQGFDTGAIDGKMGPKTIAATKAYQESVGLHGTGQAGEYTQRTAQAIQQARTLPSVDLGPSGGNQIYGANLPGNLNALGMQHGLSQPSGLRPGESPRDVGDFALGSTFESALGNDSSQWTVEAPKPPASIPSLPSVPKAVSAPIMSAIDTIGGWLSGNAPLQTGQAPVQSVQQPAPAQQPVQTGAKTTLGIGSDWGKFGVNEPAQSAPPVNPRPATISITGPEQPKNVSGAKANDTDGFAGNAPSGSLQNFNDRWGAATGTAPQSPSGTMDNFNDRWNAIGNTGGSSPLSTSLNGAAQSYNPLSSIKSSSGLSPTVSSGSSNMNRAGPVSAPSPNSYGPGQSIPSGLGTPSTSYQNVQVGTKQVAHQVALPGSTPLGQGGIGADRVASGEQALANKMAANYAAYRPAPNTQQAAEEAAAALEAAKPKYRTEYETVPIYKKVKKVDSSEVVRAIAQALPAVDPVTGNPYARNQGTGTSGVKGISIGTNSRGENVQSYVNSSGVRITTNLTTGMVSYSNDSKGTKPASIVTGNPAAIKTGTGSATKTSNGDPGGQSKTPSGATKPNTVVVTRADGTKYSSTGGAINKAGQSQGASSNSGSSQAGAPHSSFW